MKFIFALTELCLCFCASLAQSQTLELNTDLQPATRREITTDARNEQTINVINDRGMVVKSGARGVFFPFKLTNMQRQTLHLLNGARTNDASFPVEMRFVQVDNRIRNAEGAETVIPDNAGLTGLRILAKAGVNNKIEKDSISVEGGTNELRQALHPMLSALFGQLQAILPARLEMSKPVNQEGKLAIPVPGAGTLQMDTNTVYTLTKIDMGIAYIDFTISMVISQTASAVKIKAQGQGTGSTQYHIAAKRINESSSRTNLVMELDLPDGTMQMDTIMLQNIKTRDL